MQLSYIHIPLIIILAVVVLFLAVRVYGEAERRNKIDKD